MKAARRYAAVDPGSKRLGLAVADPETGVAVPREALPADGPPALLAKRVGEALADFAPTHVAVGNPVSLDGTKGPATVRARALAIAIRDTLGVKVELVDERFSTAEAARSLRTMGVDARAARSRIDSAAAVVILQSVLDRAKPTA